LGWSRAEAARRAGISIFTLGEIERTGKASDFNLQALRIAYESGGARFGFPPGGYSIRVEHVRSTRNGYRKVSAHNIAAS